MVFASDFETALEGSDAETLAFTAMVLLDWMVFPERILTPASSMRTKTPETIAAHSSSRFSQGKSSHYSAGFVRYRSQSLPRSFLWRWIETPGH